MIYRNRLFYIKSSFGTKMLSVKKQLFLNKKAAFLQNIFCKKRFFTLKKHCIFTTVQFVKKQLFYIKMTLFYKDRFFMHIGSLCYDIYIEHFQITGRINRPVNYII